MKNKGVFLVAFLIFSTLACQTRSEKPRRTYEDGIEAVDNGLEPYAIKG